ncbi:MAG: hypothetical protein KJ578_15725 [Bacteroidetes bacterium]|nr:hypothetical protein [Bacteroidota bacterium]
MKRTIKVSLEIANTNKLIQIDNLYFVYKQAVQDYLDRLFSKQELSENYIQSYDSPLSYRYKQCAKRQAFKIFKSWCRNKKKGNLPVFDGTMVLDYRFIEIQDRDKKTNG